MISSLCPSYTKKAGPNLEIEAACPLEGDFQQASGGLLSLLRWLLWGCWVTVRPMCHAGGWLQQPAVAMEANALTTRLRARSASINKHRWRHTSLQAAVERPTNY
jgi:hypothetical protein